MNKREYFFVTSDHWIFIPLLYNLNEYLDMIIIKKTVGRNTFFF